VVGRIPHNSIFLFTFIIRRPLLFVRVPLGGFFFPSVIACYYQNLTPTRRRHHARSPWASNPFTSNLQPSQLSLLARVVRLVVAVAEALPPKHRSPRDPLPSGSRPARAVLSRVQLSPVDKSKMLCARFSTSFDGLKASRPFLC
jgi:hypothetical protein